MLLNLLPDICEHFHQNTKFLMIFCQDKIATKKRNENEAIT
jgi:hypothetical protein